MTIGQKICSQARVVLPALALSLCAVGSSSAQTVSVNFQSESAQPTSGYIRDYGLPYGPRTLADQVNGSQVLNYGWVQPGTTTPVDMTVHGRDRDVLLSGTPGDAAEEELQRRDTLMHMDHPSTAPVGHWEIELPPGFYTVTVSVGDPTAGSDPEFHSISVEGTSLIDQFEPVGGNGAAGRFTSGSALVQLSDGRLTLSDAGGTNTKPNFIVIQPAGAPSNPSVLATQPSDGDTGVPVDIAGIGATDLVLPNGALDAATVTPANVLLYPTGSPGALVAANVNTTGGGDAITLTPVSDLDPFTSYTLEITDSVQDVTGATFVPFSLSFTTGAGGGVGGSIQFEKVSLSVSGEKYTQVNFGPDGRLYGATIGGEIYAWDVEGDGTLSNEQLIIGLSGRIIIGMVFDPLSSASSPEIWVTSNEAGFGSATEFSGEIEKITGTDVGTGSESWSAQTMVSRMPRSTKDHLTNSLVFGPSGERALYGTQGSNSAMGGADSTWGLRPERILSAAIYRVDLDLLETHVTTTGQPLDVFTGTLGLGDPALFYDPQAPGAPLTLFATGARNAYDLVWHSNGFLYVPTNGSAGGGGGTPANAPATTAGFAASTACQNRIDSATDGAYAGPAVSQVFPSTRDDFLFKVEAGGFYGHPNPTRCEWVLNGGNPTGGNDPGEVSSYASGVAPDRNWRGFAFNFAKNKSPNGVIEYQSNTFGGALQGKLLVVRYSGGDDVFVMTPDGSGDITATESLVDGTDQTINFAEPLDLTEDVGTGNLYVSEYGANTISLLRPLGAMPTNPELETSASELIFDGVKNQVHLANVSLSIGNAATATDDLVISGLAVAGADAGNFVLQNAGSYSFPVTLTPGQTLTPDPVVEFQPGATVGMFVADLQITSNDGVDSVGLYGLGTNGLEGGNEPPLKDVVDTLGYNIDVGWTSLTNTTSATLQGEEVAVPLFQKAGPGNVQILPVARYSPLEPLPFGYYLPNGASPVLMPLGSLSGVSPEHQALFPDFTGSASFDPGADSFGLYTTSVSHTAYTEDALNASNQPSPDGHAVRVYPLRDRAGSLVPNAYLIGFEEAANGDYNDYVFVLSNVQPPAGPPDITPPAVPANLVASGQPGSIAANWDAVGDADLAGYNVYRSTASPVTTSGQPLNGMTPITGTQYVDVVAPDTAYVYAVAAVDTSGNQSGLSNEDTATATAPPGGFVYYREVFPNTTGDDIDIATTGWTIATNASPNTNTSKGAGNPINLDGVLDGTALSLSAAEQEFGFAAAFGGSAASQHHAFTSEQVIDRSVYAVTEISWTQGHAVASAQSRVAIEIGGQWYVSTSTYSNAGGITGINYPTNAEAKAFTFTTAASAWQLFDAGTLTVGATLTAPLPAGNITAFGLYTDDAGGYTMRFDSYQVAVDVLTGGNVPPAITLTTDVSGGVNVGEGDTIGVLFTVTDVDGNLDTVEVTGADFVSLANSGPNYTATFSPQALDSDFGPYTIVITATDTDLASSSSQFTLTVFDPTVTPCAPLSTLPCADIPVAIPFALGWSGGEGGLVDADVDGTGFTMVDPPSVDPGSNADAPGYEPANLNVDTGAGTLTITTTAGLQFTNSNTQLNALGVGIDADGNGPLNISTTLTAVPDPGTEQFQQAGLWFGIDEDNYVKLVAISGTGGAANTYAVQLGSEIGGISNQLDATDADAVPTGADVTLRLALAPAANEVTAFYSVNGGTEVEVGTLATSPAVFAGIDHDANAPTPPVSFSGVFASNRNAAGSLDFTFDNFMIAADSPPGVASLDGIVNIPARGANGSGGPVAVALYPVGNPVPSFQFNPTADAAGQFSVTGITPATYEVAVKAPNTLQRVATITLGAGSNAFTFANLLSGDVNDDNVIDIADLSSIVPTFDLAAGDPGYNPNADFTGDGQVDISDLSTIVPNFDTGGENPSGAPPP